MSSKITFQKNKSKKAFSDVGKMRTFITDKPALKVLLESVFQKKMKMIKEGN